MHPARNILHLIQFRMSINSKIKQYLDYKDVSQRKFSKIMGVADGILRGAKSVKASFIKPLQEKFPDLNMDWLLFDEGEMLIESPEGKVSDTPLIYGKESIECCAEVFTLQKELLETQKKLIDAHELNQVLQGQIQPIKKHDNETAPKS